MDKLDFVHRFEPAESGATGRVLLLLHGTGGDETDLISLGREVDPNAALLSPRGRVSENGMPRFFRRFAEGVFDEEDIVFRANELADFVLGASRVYGFTEPPVAFGYSNGANIANAILLLRPEILSAAILFRTMVVLSNPPASVLTGKRVLISAGRRDPIVPYENAQRLAGLLRDRGADVAFKVQEASHGLVHEDIVAAKAWFNSLHHSS